VQAESGFMSMNGQQNSKPTKMPVALMDVLAGHQMRAAILAALWKKEKTGKGAYIKTFLNKSGIAALVNQGTNYLMAGKIPERIGSRHPNIPLYGEVFTCKDKKEIVLALGTNQHFMLLCNALEIEHLSNLDEFSTNQSRLTNLNELVEILKLKFLNFLRKDIVVKLNEVKVPFGLVNNIKEVSESKQGRNMMRSEHQNSEFTKRFSTIAFEIT
jgi:crotonobetainyl-CoA:carnitine CoA-transferase CaiB-like acyl-CoA transferase